MIYPVSSNQHRSKQVRENNRSKRTPDATKAGRDSNAARFLVEKRAEIMAKNSEVQDLMRHTKMKGLNIKFRRSIIKV